MENKENITPDDKTPQKRAWWEIPARGFVLIIIIVIMLPGHWYRAAYLYTIGRFFPETVESRIADFEEKVKRKLDLKELPVQIRILVLKAEKQVELWGKFRNGQWKKFNYYPIFSLPEGTGPKRSRDEIKTPEGVYRIAELDPNSIFNLAIKLDYPSQEDKEIAQLEKRSPESMETDFLLHGFGFSEKNISLPDEAMKELFYLISKAGLEHTELLIAPADFRKELPQLTEPDWLKQRYEKMKQKMEELKEIKEENHAETGSY